MRVSTHRQSSWVKSRSFQRHTHSLCKRNTSGAFRRAYSQSESKTLKDYFNSEKVWREETEHGQTALFDIKELYDANNSWKQFTSTMLQRCQQQLKTLSSNYKTAPVKETLRELDALSENVCKVCDSATLCSFVHPSNKIKEEAEEAMNQMGTYIHQLNANVDLFKSVLHVHEHRDQLNEEEQTVVDQLKAEFTLHGIHFPDEKRDRFVLLKQDIDRLGVEFSRLDHYRKFKAIKVPVSTIARLPQSVKNGIRIEGKTAILTADPYTADEVLKWIPDSYLRKEMYVLDNGPPLGKLKVLVEMLKKRQQLAKESSFPSYADMALKDNRMAGTPERVKKFLNDLAKHIAPKVEKEMQVLKEEKAKHEQDSTIYAWDKAFYCGITKAQKFELDGSRLAEYFSLGNCIEGLNIIVSNLFGLELKVVPMGRGESWHPSVRKVAVLEEGQVIGYIYMDLFYRDKKLKNAASFAIQFSKAKDGKLIQLPKMALVCNFGAGNPPLLSHDGVVTLFHEFGHCLNMLLSRTEYQHVAGTRAALDFVEMPSTLMEYFTWDHRVVKLFAKHYKNGDILEEGMLMNLKGSKNMFSGLSTEHQILLAMADIVLHDGSKHITDPSSLVEVLKSLQNSHTSLPHVDGTFVLTQFNHLVQYAAGYYTYLFCRVFSSNVWKKCFSENPLSREMGELYRREILQPGGSRDPNKMLRRILGRDPTMDSFLEELE